MLQRRVRVVSEGDTTHFRIEADAKHVPALLNSLGLSKASSAATPRVKRTPDTEQVRLASAFLEGSEVFLFRSNVMRCSYLSQDRPDIQETVRLLASSMSQPRQGDLAELKRLARFLKGRPTAFLNFPCLWEGRLFKGQHPFNDCPGNSLHIFSDANWAGDPTTRRSATGFVAMRSGGCLRSSSTTQSIIGLSSCESEFYGLCRATASGLGIQSSLVDLGVLADILVWSDASAARAVAARRGLGKLRHLHTRFLWLQESVALKAVSMRKIPGTGNPADVLTKALAWPQIKGHMRRLGLYYEGSCGRPS